MVVAVLGVTFFAAVVCVGVPLVVGVRICKAAQLSGHLEAPSSGASGRVVVAVASPREEGAADVVRPIQLGEP